MTHEQILQNTRFHERLAYLETLSSDIMQLLQMRFDAGIKEEIPANVRVARATDDAYFGE